MIKVELHTEKPIALQLQEAQQVALSVTPLAGTIKGRDAYSPFIGESGTWVCWNDADAQWVDTGVKAVGEKGDPGEPGTPGSDANVTAGTISAALGYMPVGPHTHDYNELTGKPQIPTVPVQDVQVKGRSILADGVAHITHDLIMSPIDDGSEVEY